MKIKTICTAVKCAIIRKSPEIFIAAGSVGLIAAGVVACKKTLKVKDIQAKRDEIMKQIDELEAEGTDEYTPEDASNDRRITKVKTALDYAKLYSIPVGIAAVSIASIVWGGKILRKRNAALVAAYATIDKSFKEYRKRVSERFGEEVEKQIRYNTKTVEEKEKVIDEETGKQKTVKTKKEVDNGFGEGYSEYARMWYCGNTGWSDDPEDRLRFLTYQERVLTEKLRRKGYLFLNEVYRVLGYQETKAGQIVGWIYDPDNKERDGYVSFGIFNIRKPKNGEFIDGTEEAIILDFNVDGPIIDLI